MRIIGKIAVAAVVAGGMVLAVPAANADVHFNVGGIVSTDINGAIDLNLLGNEISLDNPVEGVLGG